LLCKMKKEATDRVGRNKEIALLPPSGHTKGYPEKKDINRLREELLKLCPESKKLLDTTWTSEYLRIVMTRARLT